MQKQTLTLENFFKARAYVSEKYPITKRVNPAFNTLTDSQFKLVALSVIIADLTAQIPLIANFGQGTGVKNSTVENEYDLKMNGALDPLIKILIRIFQLADLFECTNDDINFIWYAKHEGYDYFSFVVAIADLSKFCEQLLQNPDCPNEFTHDEYPMQIAQTFTGMLNRHKELNSPFSLSNLITEMYETRCKL